MDTRIYLDQASDLFRTKIDRRGFFGRIVLGSAGTALGSLVPGAPALAAPAQEKQSVVSFAAGNDRRDIVYQALLPLRNDNRGRHQGQAGIIKVQHGGNDQPLCATHPGLRPRRPGFSQAHLQGQRCSSRNPPVADTTTNPDVPPFHTL